MRTDVYNEAGKIIVASGFEEIGKSLELNRQRIANIVASISKSNNDAVMSKIDEITDENSVTETEKDQLNREMQALERNFEVLQTDTVNADLTDTNEYRAVKAAYDAIHSLMYKIVTSEGVYRDEDVNQLNPLYADYSEKATELENLILATTADIDRINYYYSRTLVRANISQLSVPVNQDTSVSASVLYEGVERIGVVSVSSLKFIATNVSSAALSSPTTYFTSSEIGFSVQTVGSSVEITGCKTFTVKYGALTGDPLKVNLIVTFDSDSMPF